MIKNTYVFDVEADGLLETATKLHCLCYHNVDTGESISLTSYWDMKSFLSRKDIILVGHKIITYDIPLVEKILNIKVTSRLIDTLPLAWYLQPVGRKKYGLETYGEEFGVKKPIIEEWKGISEDEQNIINYYEGLHK